MALEMRTGSECTREVPVAISKAVPDASKGTGTSLRSGASPL
jgi:hypothetical protein